MGTRHGRANSSGTQKGSGDGDANPFPDREGFSEAGNTETTRNTESGRIDSSVNPGQDTSTIDTQRRNKGGRPRGSKNKPKSAGKETFQVSEQKASVKGKKKKSENLFSKEDAKESAIMILNTIEAFGITIVGIEGKFEPMERYMLEQGLPPILEKVSKSAIDSTTTLLAPVMLVAGTLMYGSRTVSLYNEKRKNQAREKQRQQEDSNIPATETPINSNGHESQEGTNDYDVWATPRTVQLKKMEI